MVRSDQEGSVVDGALKHKQMTVYKSLPLVTVRCSVQMPLMGFWVKSNKNIIKEQYVVWERNDQVGVVLMAL